MTAYPAHKASGIEWIGDIPEHWYGKKMKYIGSLYGGLSGKSGNDFKTDSELNKPFIPFTNIANNDEIDLSQLQKVIIKEDERQNKVEQEDLFFLMSSENFDDIGKSAVLLDSVDEVYLNSFCRGFRLKNKNYKAKFLNYLLKAQQYRNQIISEAKGFTRINLKMEKINDLIVFCPPLEEQTQIAQFLDQKTAEIDTAIADLQQLIKLLKEKRKALINEAVTKGINPKAPLKPSGIEWIGDIPEHWDNTIFKRYCHLQQGLQIPISKRLLEKVDNSYEYITTKSIHNPDDYRQYILNPKESVICFEDDIILGRTGNTGEVVTGVHGVFHNNFFKIDFNREKISKDFLVNYLKNSRLQESIMLVAGTTTIPDLNHGDFLALPLLLPPLEEQTEIVTHIEKETQRIDTEIQFSKEEINLLKEYKQALITEAVTGKIDVRNYKL